MLLYSLGAVSYTHLQMALNIARAGKKVLYFSLETNYEGISERIVAVSYTHLLSAIGVNN